MPKGIRWRDSLTREKHVLFTGVVYFATALVFDDTFWACPIKSLSGFACPGCGITRAIESLLKLEVREAISYNALVFILPITIILQNYLNKKNFLRTMLLFDAFLILFVLTYTAYRNGWIK